MSVVWLGCVVEGDGEVSAVPILVRRIAARIDPGLYVHIPRPVRVKRNRVGPQFGDVERAIELVIQQIQRPGAILVLLDADDDDPVAFGAELRERLQVFRGDISVTVILARREYEAWLLAAAESIRGQRGLPADLTAPPNPEEIRDAEGWLRSHMPGSRKYGETSDQAALTDLFDLDLACSRSPTFQRCYSEMERLLREMLPPSTSGPEALDATEGS